MNNNMSIIIRCNCGNIVELKSDMAGHQVMLNKEFREHKFSVDSLDIELDGDLEEIEDINDINVTLGNIKINCLECGDFIEIEDYI